MYDSGKRKKRINVSILRDHLRNFANLEISDYIYELVTIIGYTIYTMYILQLMLNPKSTN